VLVDGSARVLRVDFLFGERRLSWLLQDIAATEVRL